jgi:hypothetical protein
MSCEFILWGTSWKVSYFSSGWCEPVWGGYEAWYQIPVGFLIGVHVYNIDGQIGKDLGPASYLGFSIFVDLSLPLA